MLATATDLDGLPPRQANQRWLKNLFDGRAEAQLADVSHTPNEQLGFGPRHASSRVRFDPIIFSLLYELEENQTSRGTAMPARTIGWCTLFTEARMCSGPRPSCPLSYAPQVKTRPSSRRNMEWNSPHAMSTTREPARIGLPLLIADTLRGVSIISSYLSSPISIPIWPRKFRPQPQTSPIESIANECMPPAATRTTRREYGRSILTGSPTTFIP